MSVRHIYVPSHFDFYWIRLDKFGFYRLSVWDLILLYWPSAHILVMVSLRQTQINWVSVMRMPGEN
uniref:Uncharacterized protein n=1 Tax=Moniliophthora roreri TaxID=221103 RepID=A0A0W0FSV2_MONRR